MPAFGSSSVVTVVRGRGTPEEKSWQAKMGGDLAQRALFYLDDRVKTGDEIHSEAFDEPKIIAKLDPCQSLSGITQWEAQMISRAASA